MNNKKKDSQREIFFSSNKHGYFLYRHIDSVTSIDKESHAVMICTKMMHIIVKENTVFCRVLYALFFTQKVVFKMRCIYYKRTHL